MMHSLLKSVIALLAAPLLLLGGCVPATQKQEINWQPRLSEKGSQPYDCRLAWEAMPYYFPNAQIQLVSKDFRYNHMGAAMWEPTKDSTSLLILAGLDFFVGAQEWEALKSWVQEGNEVLLFCSRLDERVEQDLQLRKFVSMEMQPLNSYYDGKSNEGILQLTDRPGAYGYQGRSLEGFFQIDRSATPSDTLLATFGEPEQLGARTRDVPAPNLLRYPLGKGHLSLHAAPLVLSNYFLLQPNNRQYLDGLLHLMPANINKVYWQSYHRRQRTGNEWSVLWRNTATRWALLLAMATLLLYVLFEMKRRQRIIPELPKPENTSVQFATTIAQLYYHQGNHRNLALKMWQHFQDWLRQTHNLETPPAPDENFRRRLQGKTKASGQTVQKLFYLVQLLHQENHYFGETELKELYQTLQSIYKAVGNT